MDVSLKELGRFVGHSNIVRKHNVKMLILRISVTILPQAKVGDMTYDILNCDTLNSSKLTSFQIRSCKLSPDGHFMVSSSNDKTVKLWDCDSGQCIHTFTAHTHMVR